MTIEIFDCEQNSPEWYAARLGIPTASMYATILAKGKGGGDSLTRKTYMYKLAGEIISGEPMTNYVSAAMERGKVMEDEARDLYTFLHDAPIARVGFIKNGPTGCSPDSLIGENGMLEIKTQEAHILIETILKDKFPVAHVAQCQGGLWVAEREWIDCVCYWPKMPLFVKRAHRDEPYIKELSAAVDHFNAELFGVVNKIRGYGAPKPPKQHRHWSELSLPEQAGIRCQDKDFQRFLYAEHFDYWFSRSEQPPAERAADVVRALCGVQSRAQLGIDDAAAALWIELNNQFDAWLHSSVLLWAPEDGGE